MEKVLITPRSLTSQPPAAIGRLRESGYEVVFASPGGMPNEAELMQLVPGCVGWVAGVEPVSERVIDAADQLKAISRNGTGIDNLPLEALKRRRIRLVCAVAANANGVAELTIGLMLAALRHVAASDAGIKSGQWPRRLGAEIAGSTVGVVGCGAVGQRVARLAAAMQATVIAFDPARPSMEASVGGFSWRSLEEALTQADIVSLHCPAPQDGRPIIDAGILARMKPGAIIVNTARAALVDEDAVLAALETKQLGAFATDVFPEEPPRSLRFVGHPRVVATPHIGGYTRESIERVAEASVDNLIWALSEFGSY